MIDRHLIGDVGLAILLAFPTLALARPQTPPPRQTSTTPMVEKAAIAEQTSVEKRYNLPR